MRGDRGGCGNSANEYSCTHHLTWSPNKLWRSTSIFNLWEIQSVMWYFRPLLWTSTPLTFSMVHLPPSLSLFPVWISTGVCIHAVCNGGGGGDRVVWREYIRSYTICIWPDSEPIKLLYHPRQKPLRRRGLRQINTCRQVPLLYRSIVKKSRHLGFGVFIDIWSMVDEIKSWDVWPPTLTLQQSGVQSHHPLTKCHPRGGRWSNVEGTTEEKNHKKIHLG